VYDWLKLSDFDWLTLSVAKFIFKSLTSHLSIQLFGRSR
jgi:hypothetical protein